MFEVLNWLAYALMAIALVGFGVSFYQAFGGEMLETLSMTGIYYPIAGGICSIACSNLAKLELLKNNNG